MKFCNNCIQPDTRPNSIFNEDGICPACQYFTLLKEVDWDERIEILQELISSFPKARDQYHDCIIGVSGGKDSVRQALWARDKLGLNPLLVCLSYPPQQVTNRGANNISNLINLGFDVLISGPAPGTWQALMRESFFKFTNWAKSTELALFSCVPQIAIKYKIPIILWGENPGLQLGDQKTLGRTGYDGNQLRYMNTLGGAEQIQWMLDAGQNLSSLMPYQYPSVEDFETHNLQIIYLGWFLKDWSLINNGIYGVLNGLETRTDTVQNTGDLWGVTSLDEDWVTLNQMIKYYKFGFGRATDYVNEEIRLSRMSREQGISLAEKYDGACSSEYIESFCEYIGITSIEFWNQVTKSLNLKLFEINKSGVIKPRFRVGVGL